MNKSDKLVITRFHLVGYTRIGATKIKDFLYMPGEDYTLQLILGTNGSGKSSLMFELWFLPGNSNDFADGGKKEIEGYWKGVHYHLVSTFGDKGHHSFAVDGVELNEGGKIGLCLQLCKDHLGVTPEIRTMALDKDPLTTMGPARRRYWMLKLSDTDYTYAISRYAKLKAAHSDAVGMGNRLKKRQVDEISKLADKNVVAELTADTHAIKKLIDEVYSMRNAESKKSETWISQLDQNADELMRLSEEVDRLNIPMLENSGFESVEQVKARRDEVKIETHSKQQLSQHLFQDHEKLYKKYETLVKAGSESIGELTEKIAKAEAANIYEEAYLTLPNVAQENDPQQMRDVLKSIYPELSERLASLPANDGHYSSQKAAQYENELDELHTRIRNQTARVARLKEDVDHRRNHIQKDSLTCPNCKHNWTTMATESELKKVDDKILELQADIDAWTDDAKKLKEFLKEYSEYLVAYRSVVSMLKSAPILSNYFNAITQNARLITHPGTVASDLSLIENDLDRLVTISKNKKIIAEATALIEVKKNLASATLEDIESDLKKLEETMHIQTDQIMKLGQELKHLETLIAQANRVHLLHEYMLSATGVKKKLVNKYVYSRYQELMHEIIRTLQTQLARKEDALSYINTQQHLVDEIARQLDEAVMNERVAKAAHIALSPTSGAIAEGLHRFVNSFVGRLNKIISAIWTYPIEIQPVEMIGTGNEMDYKFPFVSYGNYKRPNKDVIEGSESMLVIFDFAFKVATLRQLGLGHLPLFLDEFESAFDDVHREKAIYFVKRLLDEGAYGQIFMVSHYESNHGSLSNAAQTCILSRDNLLLPTNIVANEHVVMS